MMRVVFLPANQAYAVIFGEVVATAQLIDIDGTYLWNNHGHLLDALTEKGLTVNDSGAVTPR